MLTISGRQHCQGRWLIMLFCCLATSSWAVEVTSLYTAEVPLDPASATTRDDAYRMALYDVLLRVSGVTLAEDFELVDEIFPEPAAYVVQFQPGAEDTLIVSFDGQAIETVLRNSGQTVWGSERPLTLVWLAVDWGGGEREILGVDAPLREEDDALSQDRSEMLRERLMALAERYGLPILLPLLDTEDLESIGYADIRGGFDDVVLDASQRYDVNSVLIGAVDAEALEPNRWRYFFGPEQREWRGELEQVVPFVADMLAAEFAVQGDLPIRAVNLTVAGVETVDAYGDLYKRLSELPVIERLAIQRVDGDEITFSVDVRGGVERLSRALRFAGFLESEQIVGGDAFISGAYRAGDTLNFFYDPR